MDFDDWKVEGISQGHFKVYLKERDSKLDEAKKILKSSLSPSMETNLRKIFLRQEVDNVLKNVRGTKDVTKKQ
jgi:hypothetical protein